MSTPHSFPSQLAALMYYMRERETIRQKKKAHEPWPWTGDKILQTFKFTNVKRLHDRTTGELLEIYEKNYKKHDDSTLLYNCAVARYFGTAGFYRSVGWQTKHDPKWLRRTVKMMKKHGEQVFTGAYIVTSGGISGPKENLVIKYLGGLWQARHEVIAAIKTDGTWEAAYNVMRRLPGFGGSGFMTKEVLQDFLLCTKLKVTDAMTWTPMGPGARRGMNRLMGRPKGFNKPEAKFIGECQALYAMLKEWWADTFPLEALFQQTKLTAHDVQFCLCEFDKYERVRLKQGRPRSLYRPPQCKHERIQMTYLTSPSGDFKAKAARPRCADCLTFLGEAKPIDKKSAEWKIGDILITANTLEKKP